MIDMPIGYRLDADGELLQLLSDDTPMTIIETISDMQQMRWSTLLKHCADRVAPNQTIEDQFRHETFYAAGALAYRAFILSDLPHENKVQICRQLTTPALPQPVVCTPHPFKELSRLAAQARHTHPELKDHIDFTAEYYCETTQNSDMASLAFCGAGIALFHIEQSLQKIRELRIEEIIRNTDWDNFLKQM